MGRVVSTQRLFFFFFFFFLADYFIGFSLSLLPERGCETILTRTVEIIDYRMMHLLTYILIHTTCIMHMSNFSCCMAPLRYHIFQRAEISIIKEVLNCKLETTIFH